MKRFSLAASGQIAIIAAMNDSDDRRLDVTGLDALRGGGKLALSAALAHIERNMGEGSVASLIDAAYGHPRAHVIGFTGPPGVGKSTLVNSLMRRWRAAGVTVGVIAVDPSSQVSHGALLGDRVRMRTDPEDQGVYIRSIASRGRLGGLAELVFPAVILMRAIFDRVIVETVGVGQSEADISAVADSVVLCVQPGSGDSLQFMKAGIMEIPDIAVVTKADMGAPARQAFADLKGALGLAAGAAADCLLLSSTREEGVDELNMAIERRFAALPADMLKRRRHEQAQGWVRSAVLQAFGETGVRVAGQSLSIPPDAAPFAHAAALMGRLQVSLRS